MIKCKKGLVVTILYANGYYVGTLNESGGRKCRISGYYRTEKDAETALISGNFTRRPRLEYDFCSGESGCQIKEQK